jgi:hypothetical protein
MKVMDAGHKFELDHLDGNGCEVLTFVKREGDGYPGNVGHYEGTNLQEVLRTLISRTLYLYSQIPDGYDVRVVDHLRAAIVELETRAARRHNRELPEFWPNVEQMPTCSRCGHVGHQCEPATTSRRTHRA